MVEYNSHLDSLFHSLSDPIRRDILHRVAREESSVGELVSHYNISFAAISKHLKVLEKSQLIISALDASMFSISTIFENLASNLK